MDFINSRENRAKRNSVELFKYFVQFLEIFGQENYGNSAEVNWSSVFGFCNQYGIFDFNDELEEIVYSESEEEFRDKAFSYIEKQILDGYPVWRLFTMSEWLYNQFEQELFEQERKKDIDYFNKTKCYRCKHYRERMEYFTPSGRQIKLEPGYPPENIDIRRVNIIHWRSCGIRDSKVAEYEKTHSRFDLDKMKFEYKKFNENSDGYVGSRFKWCLIPWELRKCPYFEDSGITPEEFIKLYFEIPRIYKGD